MVSSIGLVYSIHDSTKEVAIQKMIEASQRKKELDNQETSVTA
jgi:hypothetical protein